MAVAKIRKGSNITAQPPYGSVWFAPFWAGVLGTLPAIGSGSQTVEAFHTFWQKDVAVATRCRPTDVVNVMQSWFDDTCLDHLQWDRPPEDARAWSAVTDSALLNGSTLRKEGRSTAVEYWRGRKGGN